MSLIEQCLWPAESSQQILTIINTVMATAHALNIPPVKVKVSSSSMHFNTVDQHLLCSFSSLTLSPFYSLKTVKWLSLVFFPIKLLIILLVFPTTIQTACSRGWPDIDFYSSPLKFLISP